MKEKLGERGSVFGLAAFPGAQQFDRLCNFAEVRKDNRNAAFAKSDRIAVNHRALNLRLAENERKVR